MHHSQHLPPSVGQALNSCPHKHPQPNLVKQAESNQMAQHKTAIVTGGTSGVGLSIVKALAKANWDVYFIGRDSEKGKEVEQEVSGLGKGKGTFVQQDLARLGEVKTLANRLLKELPRLDLLANVAGVVLPNRQETAEGIEKTFAINYLSAFVLSTTLAPLLAQTEGSRIANVAGSPSTIMKTRLNFDDLYLNGKYSAIKAAFAAVHAKSVMTSVLADKYADQGIDVNSFHPGLVKSGLGRNFGFPLNLLFKLGQFFMSSESKTGIYVCTSKEIRGRSGLLFKNKKGIELDWETAYRDQLWQRTKEILARISN